MSPDIMLSFDGGYLRPMTDVDVHEGYVSGLNDTEVNRYLSGAKSTWHTHQTIRDFVALNAASDNTVHFGIWRDNSTYPCGTVRLHGIEYQNGTANIGICIFDKRVWGLRLGTKAIMAVTRWAIESLGLRWIEAGAYIDNIASQRTFLSAGYDWVFDIHGKYLFEGKTTTVKVYAARHERR